MKIGYLPTIYHTSFILKSGAKSKYPYLTRNHQIEWTLFPTGPAMIDAFASGKIDLGYIGLPPVMVGIDRGLKLKCVGGGHVEGTVMLAPGSYRSFEILGSIKSILKQFEGKTIGTPSKGSIHDVILREMVKDSDIKVKNFDWADFIPDALEDGEIQAGVGTPSLATAAAARMDSQIIIPPHKMWPYNPSYGIVVREEILEESPFITQFLKAHESACNLMRKNPLKAAQIVSQEMEIIEPESVFKTYSISPKYCASLPRSYINSTLKFIPVLQNLGYLKGDLKESDIFELEFIRKVHPGPAHYDSGIR